MKVCVYGAGAIGGFLSFGLTRVPGLEVSLIARGAHLEAMRRNGLKLVVGGTEQGANVQATDDASGLGEQDFVIVALKAARSAITRAFGTPGDTKKP